MARSIPRKDDAFDRWQAKVVPETAKHLEEWHIDTVWFQGRLLPQRVRWVDAWAVAKDPVMRNKADVAHKNGVKAAYVVELSLLVKHLKSEPGITPEQLTYLEIATAKSTGKPLPPPQVAPGLHVDTSMIDHLLIHVYSELNLRRGRPHGAVAFLVRWGILDEIPENVEELPNMAYGSSSPLKLAFPRSLSGKHVVLCGCWVNVKHECGPWSAFVRVTIP
jgi:hypothetical protein